MTEYEYSFKVESLDPYIKYCIDNGYEFRDETDQIRILYRNDNKTNARLTIKNNKGIIKKYLDFKDDILNDDVLIERRESKKIEITDDEALDSILDFLHYRKDTVLKRKRFVYIKGDVKFEIDDYFEPEVTKVVAIEGNKEKVDNVYEDVLKTIS